MKSVYVVDYGAGNVSSICKAIGYLGFQSMVVENGKQLTRAAPIILPGVGSFKSSVDQLMERGFAGVIPEVLGRPGFSLLGICLGLQVLFDFGTEGGSTRGLSLIGGRAVSLLAANDAVETSLHVGFSGVYFQKPGVLFSGVTTPEDFYFSHEYQVILDPVDDGSLVSYACFGKPFVASYERDNLFGVQFHPEKSRSQGLRVLRNFLDWEPKHS